MALRKCSMEETQANTDAMRLKRITIRKLVVIYLTGVSISAGSVSHIFLILF